MPSIDSDAGLVQSYADFAGLARLRGQAHGNEVDATRATAQQFEAMFIQQIMKTMREAGFHGIATEWWHFDFGDRVAVRRDLPRVL